MNNFVWSPEVDVGISYEVLVERPFEFIRGSFERTDLEISLIDAECYALFDGVFF